VYSGDEARDLIPILQVIRVWLGVFALVAAGGAVVILAVDGASGFGFALILTLVAGAGVKGILMVNRDIARAKAGRWL
jgi:hypothetical protein